MVQHQREVESEEQYKIEGLVLMDQLVDVEMEALQMLDLK